MTCKKCGSSHLVGPIYRKSIMGRESLDYICSTCGYMWSTPTLDAQEKKPPIRVRGGKPYG